MSLESRANIIGLAKQLLAQCTDAEYWTIETNRIVEQIREELGGIPPQHIERHPNGAMATLRKLSEYGGCHPASTAPVSYRLVSEAVLEYDDLRVRESQAQSTILAPPPIPMYLNCPICGARHIDEGEFAKKPHHTHSCQCCGLTWRPAVQNTVGVQFLPGFKNEAE